MEDERDEISRPDGLASADENAITVLDYRIEAHALARHEVLRRQQCRIDGATVRGPADWKDRVILAGGFAVLFQPTLVVAGGPFVFAFLLAVLGIAKAAGSGPAEPWLRFVAIRLEVGIAVDFVEQPNEAV